MNDCATLAAAELTLVGRLVDASNDTFLVRCETADLCFDGVYKPISGEQPLWDFPHGNLASREVAAYVVSEQAGFGVVPTTVMVSDGPRGPGMLQRWIEVAEDPATDVVHVSRPNRVPAGDFRIVRGIDQHERPVVVSHADDPRLRRMALFDAVVNNSDRKGAHILITTDRVYGVDHGVTFHTDPKLRTLLWGWAGQELNDMERDLVARAQESLPGLAAYLTDEEIEAAARRCVRLVQDGFPLPGRDWPSIPWPPL